MSGKVFSIIIPHYNNVTDLSRCLNSIPVRDDVEVIIVDDNSDPDKVDFDHFPGLNRADTMVVFSKAEKGKGPGYARNVGLDLAIGKWVVFSDSDDYFLPDFNVALDHYFDSDADVVFFRCKKQSLNGEISSYQMVNNLIDEAERVGIPDPIAYEFPCPWGKFIRRDFLNDNKIRFKVITGGDDIYFSTAIALSLRRYLTSSLNLYCVVDRPGSLTRNNHWKSFSSYTKACCGIYSLVPEAQQKLVYSWITSWWGRLWAENHVRTILLFPAVIKTLGLIPALRCYKKALKVGRWDWTNRERNN